MENNMDNDCPRYRPFAPSATAQRIVKVKKAKYSTSLDPRGYIPVYEYIINGQPIMWDRESGYVHFTGIWKSLGNSKADIVKMVDSNPELKVKKIRGGFLKIQGTWIPYEYAYLLCKQTAWMIRKDLVAMFGPRFLSDALDPSHPEYGCLLLDPKCNQKGMNNRQTTMRQVNHHPYRRSDFMRRNSRDNKLIKKNDKIVSSMSLSRLLNTTTGTVDTTNKQQNKDAAFSQSPNTTPSPTFHVVPLPLASKAEPQETTHLLPPILTSRRPSEPRITPIYSPSSPSTSSTWSSPSSPSAPSACHSSSDLILPPPTQTYSKDVIDTINATILLQRLSQDDGARPFKPMHPDSIPSKVIVGNQEYRICWDG